MPFKSSFAGRHKPQGRRAAPLSVTAAAFLALGACSTQHDASMSPAAKTLMDLAMCKPASDRKMLCGTLKAMGEDMLPDAWRSTGGPVARVTLMPAGQPVLAMRVIGNSMTVLRYEHGKRDIHKVFTVSAKERQMLVDTGAKAWGTLAANADAPTFAACKVPSIIAAETNLNGDYKYTVSHCAPLKPLRDLADAYLGVAAGHVPDLEKGLEQSID